MFAIEPKGMNLTLGPYSIVSDLDSISLAKCSSQVSGNTWAHGRVSAICCRQRTVLEIQVAEIIASIDCDVWAVSGILIVKLCLLEGTVKYFALINTTYRYLSIGDVFLADCVQATCNFSCVHFLETSTKHSNQVV